MRTISDKKIQEFRDGLERKEIDSALFLTSEPIHDVNIEYFTSFQQTKFFSFSCLLMTQDEIKLIVSPLSYDRAVREAKADEIINLGDYDRSITKVLKNELNGIKTLGIIERIFPYKIFRKFKHLEFKDISDLILSIRSIKEPKEIKRIKKACRITNFGVKIIEKTLSKKLTGKELALILEQELMKKGAEEMAFPTILTSGERSAFIHPYPTLSDQKIKKGLGLIDFGVRYKGYCSDVTVPFTVENITKKQKKILKTVQKVYEKAIYSLKIGVPTWRVHESTEDLINEEGFKLKHSIGHGLGLDLHDLPSISLKPKTKEDLEDWNEIKLKKNMVFTIEPGIYVPGLGGHRLENDVLMKRKPEVMTKSSLIQI